MFSFSNWLVDGIKSGYKNGTFPFCRATEITANYLSKGLITEAQAISIAEACPMPVEPVIEATEEVEEPIEEPIDTEVTEDGK